MVSDRVRVVWNKIGNFYDVIPKVSKSLADMRDKLLTIKKVKWEWWRMTILLHPLQWVLFRK